MTVTPLVLVTARSAEAVLTVIGTVAVSQLVGTAREQIWYVAV